MDKWSYRVSVTISNQHTEGPQAELVRRNLVPF